jgi:hypothetical protein
LAASRRIQLRGPLDLLIRELGAIGGLTAGSIHLVGETSLADIKTRPDFAVTVNEALVGFIEVKAPGKGADPRHFSNPHDKDQWNKLKSLPNLLYTDGSAFSLWRDGAMEGKPVILEGDLETAGSKLAGSDGVGAADRQLPNMGSATTLKCKKACRDQRKALPSLAR